MDLTPLILKAFSELTPNLSGIHESAIRYNIDGWKSEQKALVIGSGALANLVPGAHVAAMAADVAFLMNRMSTASYGIGAIKSHSKGFGECLEHEDFGLTLGLWAGENFLPRKGSAEFSEMVYHIKLEGKAASKTAAKFIAKKAGILIGKKLGAKTGAKVAAKISAKLAAKLGAGFVPLLGAAVGAGINWFFIKSICDSSEQYYEHKISLIEAAR